MLSAHHRAFVQVRSVPPLGRPRATSRLLTALTSRATYSTLTTDDVGIDHPKEGERANSSIYISNVYPIKLGSWDFRPLLATFREETLMGQLHEIACSVKAHGFRVEKWEIARKDGGVFLHYSYIPPNQIKHDPPPPATDADSKIPANAIPRSSKPAAIFLPLLTRAADEHGGFPSWLGEWWARWGSTANPTLSPAESTVSVGNAGEEIGVSDGVPRRANVGHGRIWAVKGRQWTEDMNRFPSNRLRVEFDGPDVSQEMLYTLFRPYGRVADIAPPSPVPAGTLRSASVAYTRLRPATTAINCLHGLSTPTNTADFTLIKSSSSASAAPLSRLRLYYERPLKAHAIRDWLSSHPRIVLPIVAFLIGTLSYTFFDPIREFFVRSRMEGVWDIERYSLVKYIRSHFALPSSFTFGRSSSPSPDESDDALGKDAWKDRREAEKQVSRWLAESPSTFVTITGPHGSGKASLVTRVLKAQDKPALVLDCTEIAKAKNDAALVSALADQTGYYPVFSFLSSLNGMIDLASVGLIGQKAGFSTPIDQQLRQVLEVVGSALKNVSLHTRDEQAKAVKAKEEAKDAERSKKKRREAIMRGGWHDGRLDCVAGNGPMSELGYGQEPVTEDDMDPLRTYTTVTVNGTETLAATADLNPVVEDVVPAKASSADLDAERDFIKSLPIVVLQNFASKTSKGDLWNVMAEWGASLVENQIAHVIVVCDSPMATKSLTKALPTKPLNTVALADADADNSLAFVQAKLATFEEGKELSIEEKELVGKLGGRMVDLETLVYKVRTGASVADAVHDLVYRNVVELRKQAFGDDSEDAKSLPWNRAQAWKVVSDLAKKGEASYAHLLQEFPFKGAEQALKAMEEHELVSVSYIDGRASRVRPGKPIFRFAFAELVKDPIFKAWSQIEYNNAVIAKAEGDINKYEQELLQLKEITSGGGDQALGGSGGSAGQGWLGLGSKSAPKERAQYLFAKMGKALAKVEKLEQENVEQLGVLAAGEVCA